MILQNGAAPILGLGLIHVTIINIAAIVIEYIYINNRHNINGLVWRTVLSNVASLITGLMILILLPEYMGGNIMHTDSPMTNFDKISLMFGLAGLFLANVIIEFPVYLIGQNISKYQIKNLFKTVLIANILTNIPVFLLYGLLTL